MSTVSMIPHASHRCSKQCWYVMHQVKKLDSYMLFIACEWPWTTNICRVNLSKLSLCGVLDWDKKPFPLSNFLRSPWAFQHQSFHWCTQCKRFCEGLLKAFLSYIILSHMHPFRPILWRSSETRNETIPYGWPRRTDKPEIDEFFSSWQQAIHACCMLCTAPFPWGAEPCLYLRLSSAFDFVCCNKHVLPACVYGYS